MRRSELESRDTVSFNHWQNPPSHRKVLPNSIGTLVRLPRAASKGLQSEPGRVPRLFSPLPELEGLGRRFARKPLSSEQDLEAYERFGVEEHVHDIISELCKLPAACDEFGLGDGIQFSNHTNSLSRNVTFEADTSQPLSTPNPRPDQFCIHRVDGNTNTLLTTVEYKPHHKLPDATFRMGLRPMDLWKKMVRSNKIPTEHDAKLRYNAERLVCSAIVQEYHVMIQEGLEYSYLTNGITRVLLRVPQDEPTTLYYFFCDPHNEVNAGGDITSHLWKTSVARVLCLCLMAFRSPVRGQEWRNRIFINGRQALTTRVRKSREKNYSRFLTPIAPTLNFRVQILVHPMNCRRHLRCRLPQRAVEYLHVLKPDVHLRRSDHGRAHLTRPTPTQIKYLAISGGSVKLRLHHPLSEQVVGKVQGLTKKTILDAVLRNFARSDVYSAYKLGTSELCPNVDHHRRGQDDPTQHPISAEDLMISLKGQLDENIDRCIPLGACGSYGAPFKLTCTIYGYTVIGKGTTSGLWKEVSREAQVYQILRKAQGSAVPVFLGNIDLAKIYFLHGAGQIRHMLIMGWGGECTSTIPLTPHLSREIHRSNKEVQALGIIHEDLRRENVLWCEELGRALIIDFHLFTLRCQPTKQRPGLAKRRLCQVDIGKAKRLRIS
ncbi:hypothetical protein N7494_005417 [Penicillium frequentans]|uniref:Protein kinase domain-containing protein n=1 Tax=Penicillium frequentans TaxID=3151616 RepID=A0AAD6CY25_9EURO|nr:hypothetical protein N7494_005417 [Penicillium glabrum]